MWECGVRGGVCYVGVRCERSARGTYVRAMRAVSPRVRVCGIGSLRSLTRLRTHSITNSLAQSLSYYSLSNTLAHSLILAQTRSHSLTHATTH